ncbi:MAG: metallophosphoesterase [Planctomycetota bacterium]|nr:MAG: metallophosphoesterase [Planctomycetota bacterium]
MKRAVKIALAAGALALAGLGVYSLQHGLRYPPLQFDPRPLPAAGFSELGWRVEAQGAYYRDSAAGLLSFRAYVPMPSFTFAGTRGGTVKLIVENIHPEAELVSLAGHDLAAVRTGAQGLQRQVEFELAFGAVETLSFRFPRREVYRFAAFGDAGGGGELDWCFRRAGELGADFILHLGDIGYRSVEDGYDHDDMDDAIDAFLSAPVPVYAAVGNHDFHGGHRYRYRFFQEHFGPLNAHFTVGGVWFVNLDTAADTLPPGRGQRGALLRQLERGQEVKAGDPAVVFTHRPLEDPRVLDGSRAKAHALNRAGEKEFLYASLSAIGADVLLAGHIHASFDFTHNGLRTIIAGEGLGQRGDTAQILIGEYREGTLPQFRWEPLNMPENLRGRDLQAGYEDAGEGGGP